ncbi:MAG: putative polyphosphate/ATP-dependent NAD kinase [Paraglaciecola psychrophila]|jgi:predicted polyphosphate/ATP-dependent NAD kinase
MGADCALELGLKVQVVGRRDEPASAADTVAAARTLRDLDVDLLLFAGGDGTARDIVRAVGDSQPVLGIPAGVKMHSGVYAISPLAAGAIVERLINGGLVDIALAEVRDIDEQAFREGAVRARFYGELLVPREGGFLQQVKSSGREVEPLTLQDIGADIVESMDDDCLYFIGPGSTAAAVMTELGLDNTLLGVDAVKAGVLVAADLSEQGIMQQLAIHSGAATIVLTAIGGQGHIIGRGNQQFSPAVIRSVGIENIVIVATKTKIRELEGRPLLVDSGDLELDQQLAGFRPVITGYHDAIIYAVAEPAIVNAGDDSPLNIAQGLS